MKSHNYEAALTYKFRVGLKLEGLYTVGYAHHKCTLIVCAYDMYAAK